MIRLNRKDCPAPRALQSDYRNRENKRALMESSFGKCMYCESKITHIDYGDVEHIKPKSRFSQYMYDWKNLGFACVKCNRENKRDKYDPDLINPYEENPEEFLGAACGIFIAKNESRKGQITLDIVNLNRPDLLEKRYTELMKLQHLIERYNGLQNLVQKEALKEQIEEEISKDKEYSASKKSLYKANRL